MDMTNITTFKRTTFQGSQTTFLVKAFRLSACFLIIFALLPQTGFAQSLADGANAIEQAATDIETYFDPISNVIFAIATIIAILGAVRVYTKWSMGDPDVMSSAAGWFGSAIFLIASVAIVKSFFGIG